MRIEARSAVFAVAFTSLASAGYAADVSFDPTITASVYKDGNVRGVGERQPSDTVGSVALNLAWSVRNPRSSFSFAYRPRHEFYNDEMRPDFTGHTLNGSYSKTISDRTSFAWGIDYNRSDRQEIDPNRPDDAVTYLRRRTFQSGGTSLSGSFAAGRRSSLSWRIGARLNRGQDLNGDDFQNSTSYDGGFGWAYHYSEQGSAGLSLGVQRFTYESSPSVDVISLGHTGSRRFSRTGTFTYNFGALRGDDGTNTNTAASLNASARWTTGRQSSVSLGARQGASAGSGQSGATLDRGAWLNWSYARPRGFGVSVTAGYWDRQFLNQLSTVTTRTPPPSAVTVSDNFSWTLGRHIRVGAFHSFHHQRVPPGGDADLATSYNNFGVSMTWIIRGEGRGRG